MPSWPVRWYGRGLAAWADAVVTEALIQHGAVGPPFNVAVGLAGPTILEHGPDYVRERFLLPILTGEASWCQLFSEPGAGSDLAGLSTRAQLDGDEWVINGQKLWTTSADHADFGLLLARTDYDAPKHQGLTYFALPMRQSGVTVRPLRQMNGYASFNEVFLDGARVDRDAVVGAVGAGWSVARTTLAHERRYASRRRVSGKGGSGRAVAEAREEAREELAPYVWYPQRAGRVDLLIEQARSVGRSDETTIRQEIARCVSLQKISAWTAERASANRAAGRSPGPEGSIGKLAMSLIARAAAGAHTAIVGPAGMLVGPEAPLSGTIAEVLLSVPAQSIAGGTDEIQKNILAENVLGLPREPAPDRELPFRNLPRNA